MYTPVLTARRTTDRRFTGLSLGGAGSRVVCRLVMRPSALWAGALGRRRFGCPPIPSRGSPAAIGGRPRLSERLSGVARPWRVAAARLGFELR